MVEIDILGQTSDHRARVRLGTFTGQLVTPATRERDTGVATYPPSLHRTVIRGLREPKTHTPLHGARLTWNITSASDTAQALARGRSAASCAPACWSVSILAFTL